MIVNYGLFSEIFGGFNYITYLCFVNQLKHIPMKKIEYEMFSPSGERACQSLVNRITKKIQGTKRVTAREIDELIDEGMEKIAVKHSEIWDTEPRYHIKNAINKAMMDAGYQTIY